jgi:hypothetical protein
MYIKKKITDFLLQIVKKMEVICSLLPGADEPLQIIDGDEVVYEEIEEYEPYSEQIEQFPASTNGDNGVKSLPQPSAELSQPLSLEIDPVSRFFVSLREVRLC